MAREGPAKDWRSQLSTPSPTAGFPPELEEGQSLNRNQLRIIWYETFYNSSIEALFDDKGKRDQDTPGA